MFTIDRPTERTSSDHLDDPASGSQSSSEGPEARAKGERAAVPAVVAVAALASLGAGAIHATAAGAHGEFKAAVVAFTVMAVLQIGWGVAALVRPSRLVYLAGVLINGANFVGWVWAKTSGISFIDGLKESEPAGFPDTLAAALAAAAVVGAGLALLPRLTWVRRPNAILVGVAALATLGLASPAMVKTGGHTHDDHSMAGMGGHDHDMANMNSAIPPAKYDGTLPVDFSGVPGVTPEQQAFAEDLATRTIKELPQWSDYHVAEAAGYRSIGDGLTGTEHFMRWDIINDDVIYDPNQPESLVYDTKRDGTKTLAAAMYMLPNTVTLETFPRDGGALIQPHIHDNLCFTRDNTNGPKVAGITNAQGQCAAGLQKFDPPAPMIHVWIRAHPCGPFAALEGIGGGQIAAGETVNCDHVHGTGT